MWIDVIKVLLGLGLLSISAEYLVHSSVKIAQTLSIPKLLIGLTIVSFGTSAPELAVSSIAALQGKADMTLGNIVGSNLFNSLVIVGLTAAIFPVIVSRRLLRFDLPIAFGASLLVAWMAYGRSFDPLKGWILLGLLALYLASLFQFSKKPKRQESRAIAKSWRGLSLQALIFLVTLTGLIFGSQWFVAGAANLARAAGVSELIVGLSLVAVGTSIPEVATSISAAFKRESGIAIGNAIGSNIFNLLGVLGISVIIAPANLQVSPELLSRDLPVLLAASILMILAFLSHRRLSQREGVFLLLAYGLYAVSLYFSTLSSHALSSWSMKLIYFLLAPSFLLFVLLRTRQRMSNRRRSSA
ncbi:MAG: hypothetical protein EA369_00855 [Bradymonadales bacterium]|nr:MAG: hypothetical protein EA369_00855 [Bradymonadales bacterium]